MLSLQQIRMVSALGLNGSAGVAADALAVSTATLLRHMKAVEARLGLKLFGRSGSLAVPTFSGRPIVESCIAISQEIADVQKQIGGQRAASLGNHLSLKHLNVLLAVVETQNATAAGVALGISQPAISKTILQLETIAGLSLFLRNQSGLTPSSKAFILARTARRILADVDALPRLVSADPGSLSGRLIVGVSSFSQQVLVAECFQEITRHHRMVDCQSWSGNYRLLCMALRGGEIDCFVGMMRPNSTPDDFLETKLCTEEFKLITSKEHPLVHDKPTLSDLVHSRWILPPKGTPPRRFIEREFNAKGLSLPQNILRAVPFGAVNSTVARSGAIGIISASANTATTLSSELHILNVEFESVQCDVAVTLVRDPVRANPALDLFVQLLAQTVQ
ncbi:LysR family transcriptional regulator [Sulfitobacter sp. AS92]|uniref:LysR family transcriptional regulator n=1 Tax=Sulfitobacter sp. AS92 TaxID=3135783 RepID=UPI00319DC569